MKQTWKTWTLPLAATVVFAGCGSGSSNHTPSTEDSTTPGEHDEHGGHEHGGHDDAADEHEGHDDAADMALVMKQATCPVSGEELGSMGTPIKKTVGDEVVLLCCNGCSKEFDANPEKYLAGGSQ